MDEDFVSTCLRTKLSSNLREAEAEPGHSSSIISCFQSLENQILERSSGCGIPVHVDVLYKVMGALSECRVFSYERSTAKSAVSMKRFFDFIRLLHHPLSQFLFKKRMIKRLNDIKEELGNLSPADAPAPAPAPQAPVVPQSEPTVPISDIIGLDEQAAQIEMWLTLSSSDTLTEIAIVGKWGCGKTALAKKVFATPTIENSFSLLIWVPLSGTMPKQEQEQEEEERVRVVKCIKEKIGQDKWDELNGKRYLMVLDDAWWSGEVDLDMPQGSGGALILTTRRDNDFGYDHVIRLKAQLSDEICGQIFYKAAHQQAKLDPTEPLLSAMRKDVIRNSRGRPLAVKTLGTIIPDLLLQRKHWIRAQDLRITWGDSRSYWRWRNEGTEKVAVLVNVCWLEIIGQLELKMFLLNTTYSAYLVYKLKERRENLDVRMWGGVMILGKDEMNSYVYIDGDRPGPAPWAEAEAGTGWMEIKLGEFFNADGAMVQARLIEKENGQWKSGLIVKGISFRLKALN